MGVAAFIGGYARGEIPDYQMSALAMAMLPEEFPVVLAIFLALGALRLSRVGVLARRAVTQAG